MMPTQPPERPLWFLLLTLSSVSLFAGCTQLPYQSPSLAQEPAEIEPDTETAAVAEEEVIPGPQESPQPGQLYEWNGHGRMISHVVIDTNAQRARFYDGREQIGWTTIASGVSAHPTPRGEFEIIEKVKHKRSNLYGRIYDASGELHKRNAHARRDPIPEGGKFVGARMPHFMRMTYDGIGMHAGAIPRPGQPASHGCIRLPDEIASNLFAHVDLGTRITVVGDGPDYGDYAERIRRQRSQERRKQTARANADRQTTSRLAASDSSQRAQPASAPSEGHHGEPDSPSPMAVESDGQTDVTTGPRTADEGPATTTEDEPSLAAEAEAAQLGEGVGTAESEGSPSISAGPQPEAPANPQQAGAQADEPRPEPSSISQTTPAQAADEQAERLSEERDATSGERSDRAESAQQSAPEATPATEGVSPAAMDGAEPAS